VTAAALDPRAWTLPGYAALAAVLAAAVLAPGALATVAWAPFLLGLVLFGLPHGAVDHHVPRRLGRRSTWRFPAGYVLAVLGGLALWSVAPVATLLVFLVVAALHWGAGDAWYARAVHGRAPFSGPAAAAAFVAGRGALPVALPALAHPDDLREGASAILAAVGGAAAPALDAGLRAAGLVAVGLCVLAAVAASVADHARAGRPRGALVDVAELGGLAAFFAVVPAIPAVGAYLVAWHAPRHVARLVASDPAQAALAARRPGAALAAWLREAAPMTALSLAGLALLAATAWRVEAGAAAVGGAALALVAALTFPHAAVVLAMDRAQRVFAREAGRRGSAGGVGGGPGKPSGVCPKPPEPSSSPRPSSGRRSPIPTPWAAISAPSGRSASSSWSPSPPSPGRASARAARWPWSRPAGARR